MTNKQRMILDLILSDILPLAIAALATLVMMVVYVPALFVGILLGYLGCKHQAKLIEVCKNLTKHEQC